MRELKLSEGRDKDGIVPSHPLGVRELKHDAPHLQSSLQGASHPLGVRELKLFVEQQMGNKSASRTL